MANNKKPRKRHIPRRNILPMTIRHNSQSEQTLQLVPHTELMKFREGIGDEIGWNTITARLNVGLVAAYQSDYDPEYLLLMDSLKAIVNVRERFLNTGRWGLSGDDLKSIGDGLVATDNLQLSITRKQLSKAIDYVFKNAGALDETSNFYVQI